MTDKSDEVGFLKDKIIDEAKISKKELDKLILEKKKEVKKTLGSTGKIDDNGVLHLIAQQNFGISLVPQPKISPKSKSSFQQFLDLRDNARETSLYVWENLRTEINNLLIKVKNEDPEVFKLLEDADKFLITIAIPSIFKTDETWFQPKDLDELNREDIPKLMNAPEIFRQFFNKVYTAFLNNARYASIDSTKGLFSIHQAYENENKHIRYPNDKKNPYFDEKKSNDLKKLGKSYDWTWNYETSNEFLECYYGMESLIDSMRNFNIHNNDMKYKIRFNKAGREIKDPLTGMTSTGNFLTLANLSIYAIYQYIELIQIWLDSQIIGKKNK